MTELTSFSELQFIERTQIPFLIKAQFFCFCGPTRSSREKVGGYCGRTVNFFFFFFDIWSSISSNIDLKTKHWSINMTITVMLICLKILPTLFLCHNRSGRSNIEKKRKKIHSPTTVTAHFFTRWTRLAAKTEKLSFDNLQENRWMVMNGGLPWL